MTQLQMFETAGPAAHAPHVEEIIAKPQPEKRRMASTSLEAYDKVTAAQQRGKVLKAIELAGDNGLTIDELAARWDVAPNRISGRFTELCEVMEEADNEYGPWIQNREKDGKVITRPTRTGKAAKVWFAIVEDYSEGVKRGK